MAATDEIYKQIGELVRVKRELYALTQDELATRVGLTRTSITNIEKGRQRVQVHTLYAIADALRSSPFEFLPVPKSLPEIDVHLPKELNPKEQVWVRSVLSSRSQYANRDPKIANRVEPGTKPEKLLKQAGVEGPPVPIDQVARFLGAQINYAPFKGEMSGLLFHNKEYLIIGLNSHDPKERQRFAIAHELGHFILHKDRNLFIERNFSAYRPDPKLGFTTDKVESSANDFAANLLIPLANLKRDLKGKPIDYQDSKIVSALAELYIVSVEAMTYQLIMLENMGYK